MVTEQPLLVRSPLSSIMALARACPGPPLSVIAHSIVAAETEEVVYAARAPASCLQEDPHGTVDGERLRQDMLGCLC